MPEEDQSIKVKCMLAESSGKLDLAECELAAVPPRALDLPGAAVLEAWFWLVCVGCKVAGMASFPVAQLALCAAPLPGACSGLLSGVCLAAD